LVFVVCVGSGPAITSHAVPWVVKGSVQNFRRREATGFLAPP